MLASRMTYKDKILSQLQELLHQNLPGAEAEAVCDFLGHNYLVAPLEALCEHSLDRLYTTVLSCWQHIQQRPPRGPKIRVYNPDLEQHGWHCTHTIVEILHEDMPFLVDSVRLELNRQGLGIHHIHNAVLTTRRDSQHRLLHLLPFGTDEAQARRESLISVEVDRHTDPERLKAIQAGLQTMLKQVCAVVEDTETMIGKVVALRDGLASHAAANGETLEETRAFIDWLLDGHFTLLGYEEYRIEGKPPVLTPIEGSELGTLRLREGKRGSKPLAAFNETARAQILQPQLIAFAKDRHRSRVHRRAYLDLIVIKRLDAQGEVVFEACLYGFYNPAVTMLPPTQIPLLRRKVASVIARSGFDPQGHNGKELSQILCGLPREELFLCEAPELYETAIGIFNLQERRKVSLFMRQDPCGQFVSFLYFVPRDIFSTALRVRVQTLLKEYCHAEDAEFTTTFSESILARIHFVLRIDPERAVQIDPKTLESLVVQISSSWDDELHKALIDTLGEEQGNAQANLYRGAFSSAYREHFMPANAAYDIQRLNELDQGQPLAMSFYRVLEQNSEILRFKLFTNGYSPVLSDVVPILENLGMRVIGEHPYEVKRADQEQFWLHDFTLISSANVTVDLQEVKALFQDAFAAIWAGYAENDEFNRLVIGAHLSWHEVAMLRAYARYNQQIRFGFSQPYIAETLGRHVQVTKLLVALFRARFDPQRQASSKVEALAERIEHSLLEQLEKVDNLNDDHILRRYLELIKATLRTSYFQSGADGERKPYLAFKLSPGAISDCPLPRPEYEIFVYSPQVEGVHLRGGKVARGGLRWSDRLEDYRTEILGLVKAQQVKNAVIVPVGAKGGFVAKQLPEGGGREAVQAEGVACYQVFIRALLDLTDNLKGGQIIPPPSVVRHDTDDPYLVVAADKGTATFSDIANGIAAEYDFWLGDAFASGGSQGYDHKGMGITARGAWESVKRHFREQGLDTQAQDFTVVGIGDMGGDVFGNGMLLSEHIRLVAAFNHQHIFIDPDPDAAVGFAERKRLFELPRSGWSDYNQALISTGGGVFSRAAKSIPISAQMQRRFDIRAEHLPPNALICALLKAPVDLLWNGGIGTYVKASVETHAEVGDKANDNLRINGNELRCRVLGEGGNLGFTQLGRIEFSLTGGAANTDFIDNAGGVDCSDHEVNIKILLNEVVANGDMTLKQRNALLKAMTDEVAELVLKNNYRQVQAVSLAQTHAKQAIDEYLRVIQQLEATGKLDRALEALPDDALLAERQARGSGLTRPELAVLISYTKADLKEALADTWISRDPYLAREIEGAFPARLVGEFNTQVHHHRLRREIIATQIANGLVNQMGLSFVHRLKQATGAEYADIAAAYVIARDVFELRDLWHQIEALDHGVENATQQAMMADLIRLTYRASHWFLRNSDYRSGVAALIERFKPGVAEVRRLLPQLLQGYPRERWKAKFGELRRQGVPEALAAVVSGAESHYALLGIIQAAQATEEPLKRVAGVYFDLGERLDLHWLDQQIANFSPNNLWQSRACNSFRDDLDSQQRALTLNVVKLAPEESDTGKRIDYWIEQHAPFVKRWQAMLQDLRTTDLGDCAIFAVALGELMAPAQKGQSTC